MPGKFATRVYNNNLVHFQPPFFHLPSTVLFPSYTIHTYRTRTYPFFCTRTRKVYDVRQSFNAIAYKLHSTAKRIFRSLKTGEFGAVGQRSPGSVTVRHRYRTGNNVYCRWPFFFYGERVSPYSRLQISRKNGVIVGEKIILYTGRNEEYVCVYDADRRTCIP